MDSWLIMFYVIVSFEINFKMTEYDFNEMFLDSKDMMKLPFVDGHCMQIDVHEKEIR